ncbi:MAG TPA: DUF4397 domain-containing protein [Candidatus Limnocylindrales bacterium]|nr:DUF4397 domain-containing protein [Candidatus Limnocylindrales bacterium]
MHRRFGRLAALLGAGALALAITAPALAADAAKLTAVVAVDSTDAPEAGKAWVRVLHGSPDAPAVDVFANDGEILSNVPFGTISAYLPVDAGTYNIKVCVANDATTDPSAETCVIDADLPFEDGKKYTVAATDLVAQIKPQMIEDGATANAEQAQVRVVHFSADTPAVDVLTQDGTPIGVNNLAYPSATGYLALPAGSYDLKVCATGTTDVCPLDPDTLALEAGMAYSVFAIGSFAALTPEVTPPPTDTVGATESSNGTGIFAALAILGVAAIGSIVMGRRLAAGRVEK